MSIAESMYPALRDAVKSRLDVVADAALRERDPAAHLEVLKRAAAVLDALVARLPADADPMIRHYLERQSYTKALDWLEAAVTPTARDSSALRGGI